MVQEWTTISRSEIIAMNFNDRMNLAREHAHFLAIHDPDGIRWVRKGVGLAFYIANEWSKDPTTKVGAVIIESTERRNVLSLGFNGFPRGIKDTPERLNDRVLKNKLTHHAERNALDNADRSVAGAWLITTLPSCFECAKAIRQRGISRVFWPDQEVPERWKESIHEAMEFFHECGVVYACLPYDQTLGLTPP